MVKNCVKSSVLLLITMLALSAFSVSEPETDTDQEIAVETYDPPVPWKKRQISAGSRNTGYREWVTLHYMVSPSGSPYEIEVVDSSGNRSLERAAITRSKKVSIRACPTERLAN